MSDEQMEAGAANSEPLDYRAALERLGLAGDTGPRELRRAYRKALAQHPPDRDPEGFRAIRGAYELLQRPERALDALLSFETSAPMPQLLELEAEVDVDRELPRHLVRALVSELDAKSYLSELAGGEDGA